MNQQKHKKKRWLILGMVLVLLSVGCTGFYFWGNNAKASAAVAEELKKEDAASVEIKDNVIVTDKLEVYGEKTLTGEGTITGSILVKSGATLKIAETVNVNISGSGTCIKVEEGGTLELSNATVKSSGAHAIENAGTLKGTGITIKGAGDLAVKNTGSMEIDGLTIEGSAKKAVYNTGTAKLTNVDIDGSRISNESAEYLIDNNGGILELTKATIKSAKETAIYNRSNAKTVVDEVTIEKAGTQGVVVDEGSSLTGNGLKVHDAASNAIYNKGTVEITDLETEGGKYGVACRYNGSATLAGTINITAGNPIRIYGPDDDKDGVTYSNEVNVASEAKMTLKATNGHAVNNKGSFIAAKDSEIIVAGVEGSNVNALNNNGKNAKMKLGKVTIESMDTKVTMYDAETMNTNSGNGIMNTGKLVLRSDVTISGIKVDAPETNNTVGSGLVTKGTGKVTGKGSITVDGGYNGIFIEDTSVSLSGENADIKISNVTNQGIYIAEANGSLKANDITISDAGKIGILFNNKDSVLRASGDIVINNTKTYAINNNNGAEIFAHSITIDGVAAANDQVNAIANGTGGVITVRHDVVIKNVSGSLSSTKEGHGNAISVGSGIIEIGGNLIIENVETTGGTGNAARNGIYAKGAIFVDGNVSIKNVPNNGMFLQTTGTVHACGDITVDSTGGHGIYLADGGAKNVTNVTGVNITVTNAGNNGIYVRKLGDTVVATGKVTVTTAKANGICVGDGTMSAGSIEISDITNKAGIENNGSINVTGTSVKITGIKNSNDGRGIVNKAKGVLHTSEDTTVELSNINSHGLVGEAGSHTEILGEVSASSINGQGIYVAGTAEMLLNNVTLTDIAANGIYENNAAGQLHVTGDVNISGTGENGICNTGAMIYDGTVSVSNTAVKKDKSGIENKGTIQMTGSSVTISDVGTQTNNGGHGINNTSDTGKGLYGVITTADTTTVTITNVVGKKSNGIQNVAGATMILGNVNISDIEATDAEATNVGDGIWNEGTLTLNAAASISKVSAAKSANENAGGVVNIGTINGKGGIVVGSAEGTEKTVNVGIFSKGTASIALECDVAIYNTKSHGIYLADNAKLAGNNITIMNASGNGAYVRHTGCELTASGNLTVDTTSQNGICSGGKVTVAGNTTVSNVTGGKVNGIRNEANASMTLGNVSVSGVKATSTTDTNVGNGIWNAGALTLNGTVRIEKVSGGKADKTTASGIVNTGTIDGTGSVVVGSSDEASTDTVYNGIYLIAGSSMDIDGDVETYHATNRGILVEGAGAKLSANNITVKYIPSGRAITVDNKAGELHAAGTITIEEVAKDHAFETRGKITAANITTKNTEKNGLWVREGSVTVTGDISIDTTNEHGMAVAGAAVITANGIDVKNIKGNDRNGILAEGGSQIYATDHITVDTVTSGHGILMKKSTVAATKITINNINKNGIYFDDNASSLQTYNLILDQCGSEGIYAKTAITSDQLQIGALWYVNVTNYKNDNVNENCFGSVNNSLPQ